MQRKLNLAYEGFPYEQLNIAVGLHEKELARIERETIGWIWNVRQKDILNILGARALAELEGKKLDLLKVTDFERGAASQFSVTLQCIQNDINALKDADMLEKVFVEGNAKTKMIQLTEHGRTSWFEYANQRTALILATNVAILSKGEAPKTWRSKIKEWAASIIGEKSKAAAIAMISIGLLGSMSVDTKAELNLTSSISTHTLYTVDQPILNYGAYDEYSRQLQQVGRSYLSEGTLYTDEIYTLADREGFYTDFLPSLIEVQKPISIFEGNNTLQEAVIFNPKPNYKTKAWEIADREGFYNEFLPKAKSYNIQPQANYNNWEAFVIGYTK